MPKVTLDRDAFKALASDTRLDILRVLDGKKMSLKDISSVTKLNKATLHEHLSKLYEAGLVKRNEREGHKWVYYNLSWKGKSLLHPENTRIVVLFSATFSALFFGVVGMYHFVREQLLSIQNNETLAGGSEKIRDTFDYLEFGASSPDHHPLFLYIGIGCLVIFVILMVISIWRFRENKEPKL
jgi:DNA-binding transcriptional ArsR family regulator